MDYTFTQLWYSGAMQVRYYDSISKKYEFGIVYNDRLIDARTGEDYDVNEIVKLAEADGIHFDKAVDELSWNDLTNSIK